MRACFPQKGEILPPADLSPRIQPNAERNTRGMKLRAKDQSFHFMLPDGDRRFLTTIRCGAWKRCGWKKVLKGRLRNTDFVSTHVIAQTIQNLGQTVKSCLSFLYFAPRKEGAGALDRGQRAKRSNINKATPSMGGLSYFTNHLVTMMKA